MDSHQNRGLSIFGKDQFDVIKRRGGFWPIAIHELKAPVLNPLSRWEIQMLIEAVKIRKILFQETLVVDFQIQDIFAFNGIVAQCPTQLPPETPGKNGRFPNIKKGEGIGAFGSSLGFGRFLPVSAGHSRQGEQNGHNGKGDYWVNPRLHIVFVHQSVLLGKNKSEGCP